MLHCEYQPVFLRFQESKLILEEAEVPFMVPILSGPGLLPFRYPLLVHRPGLELLATIINSCQPASSRHSFFLLLQPITISNHLCWYRAASRFSSPASSFPSSHSITSTTYSNWTKTAVRIRIPWFPFLRPFLATVGDLVALPLSFSAKAPSLKGDTRILLP